MRWRNRALQGQCSSFASTLMRSAGFVSALPVLLEGTQKEASVRPGCGEDFVVQIVFFSAVY